jgi:hypothetical protein
MSDTSSSGGDQAHDGIVATFSTPQTAVGLTLNNDTQAYTLVVATGDRTFTFAVPADKALFVGAVSHCALPIASVRVLPPVPSDWWRILSVTFAR